MMISRVTQLVLTSYGIVNTPVRTGLVNDMHEIYLNEADGMFLIYLSLLVILPSFMKFFTGIIFYQQDKLGIAILI